MHNLELAEDLHHDDSYYHEYIRLYLANIALTAQVKDLVE